MEVVIGMKTKRKFLIKLGPVTLILFLIFFLSYKIPAVIQQEIDPISQFNQTSSINITGNASTIVQSEIDAALNVNSDGLTWDVTKAEVDFYPILNQNFTSDASGWIYGEENDGNNMASGDWDPDSGRLDPGSYNFTIADTSTTAIAQVDQYINYSFNVDALPAAATAYASFRLTCDDDQLVYAKLNLIRPTGDVQNLWTSSTYQTTSSLDTGWINVSVDVLSNFTTGGIGAYQLSLMIHTETDDAGNAAQKTTCYHYLDDAGIQLIFYQVEVEHNTTISYPGDLREINVMINFSSTTDDAYGMKIYDFAKLKWDITPCQNQSVIANNYYILWCNITTNPTNYISSEGIVRVRLNSTADNDQGTLKEEYVQFYVGYSVGYLEVELVQPNPLTITYVIQNNTFIVNSTVYCRNAPCGNVYGTLMYNLSSPYPDTRINTTYGDKPFFINETPAQATKACPNNPLNANDFCNLTWIVNASGEINTNWKIGVLFNSSLVDVEINHTLNATISIVGCTISFTLQFSTIDFGNLLPRTYNNSAIGNSNNLYNITVNEGSCNLNLYINGTDLVNQTLNSVIKVGNISWSNISSNINEGYFPLSYSESLVRANVPANTNVTTWYWINVPSVYAGIYKGNITIKAERSS